MTEDLRADWAPDRIKAAIYQHGISMEALAIKHGYSSSVVRLAICRESRAGEKLISDLIGVPLKDIWPSRYDETGRCRSRPKSAHQTSHRPVRAHRQNGAVA